MFLAFATKLYVVFLFIPSYIFILIQQRKLKTFILNSAFLTGLLFFLIFSLIIIYLRESDTPGFIHELIFKDAGRIFKVVENHKESATFYIDNLFRYRFSNWSVLYIK